jgi:DNA-directed RNA polymerase subunit RPC12/RpoP
MAEECAECGASFAGPTDLLNHLKKAHPSPKERPAESLAMNPASQTPGYACSFCGAKFATPQELAAHDLKPHKMTRKFGRVTHA